KAAGIAGPVFFDRGIPDNLAYAFHFGFDHPLAGIAASEYRYNGALFFFPAWESIYTCDEERIISFEIARGFGEHIRAIYQRHGYRLVDVPCVSIDQRLEYIIGCI